MVLGRCVTNVYVPLTMISVFKVNLACLSAESLSQTCLVWTLLPTAYLDKSVFYHKFKQKMSNSQLNISKCICCLQTWNFLSPSLWFSLVLHKTCWPLSGDVQMSPLATEAMVIEVMAIYQSTMLSGLFCTTAVLSLAGIMRWPVLNQASCQGFPSRLPCKAYVPSKAFLVPVMKRWETTKRRLTPEGPPSPSRSCRWPLAYGGTKLGPGRTSQYLNEKTKWPPHKNEGLASNLKIIVAMPLTLPLFDGFIGFGNFLTRDWNMIPCREKRSVTIW